MQELIFSVTDFVAVLNQTLDFAYPIVAIEGELTNFRVSRGKWVYFDIKDDMSSVKCFGTIYLLPGPLEDGMMVRVTASPRLHPLYNFSLNLQSITPVGEGSLRRASDLLVSKLTAEGLFDAARKRPLPYAPEHIGLITSRESAAYADFIKIINERWMGVTISHYDVQVQGEPAIANIVGAIETMNQLANPPEVLIITRGGGSSEDLAAFNAEQVTRAIAASRIPTIVAIGHETDTSLAELAADLRASTPSNAAQLLVPDKRHALKVLDEQQNALSELLASRLQSAQVELGNSEQAMRQTMDQAYLAAAHTLARQTDLLQVLSPDAALRRGYAVARDSISGRTISSVKLVQTGNKISVVWHDGAAGATITSIKKPG